MKPPLASGTVSQGRCTRRGVALVIVLGALTVLTVMMTEFQDEASAEFGNATAERDALKAEYAAKSAVALARLLIAAEPTMEPPLVPLMVLATGRKFQIPVWLYADQILGAFNEPEAQKAFAALSSVDLTKGKKLGLPGAAFDLVIVDEDSKINANLPARPGYPNQRALAEQLIGLIGPRQYDPMFENRDAEGNFADRQTICSALIDWVDPDADLFNCDLQNYNAQAAAAEDTYYELLKRPYHRKNSAFDSLQEMHLVRGITDEFWSTFVDPDPADPRKRVFTVWGQEKRNWNTLNPQTRLSAVCGVATPETSPCNDPTQFETLMMMLNLVENLVPGVPILGSPDAFVKVVTGKSSQLGTMLAGLIPGFKPVVFKASEADFKKGFTTESKVFSFYATGRVKSGKRETRVRIHAVVDFRGAPPPGVSRNAAAYAAAAMGLDAGAPLSAANPATTGTGGATAGLPEGATDDAIASVLKPSPGGNVIYYRIE